MTDEMSEPGWERLDQVGIEYHPTHGDGHLVIQDQLETSSLPLPTVPASERGFAEFPTTELFWQDLLTEQVRARRVVKLRDVRLSEWFPRSPGLFLTPQAAIAREHANDYILRLNEEEKRAYLASGPSDPVVYNIEGKSAMLRSGVGCLRLKERKTVDGPLYFMSASSNHKAHEGVPLALTPDQYARFIDEITQLGAMRCTITGELRFMQDSMLRLYGDYVGVPRLYLLTQEILPLRHADPPDQRRPTATAAVLFKTNIESWKQVQAAYVTFATGRGGTLPRGIGWLESYVERHDGTIITDFDEQTTRFPNAIFSLNKITHATLNASEISSVAQQLWLEDSQIDRLMAQQVVYGDVINTFINAKEATLNVGDRFENIGAGVTIVNRSFLNNALNRTQESYGTEAKHALELLAEEVSRTGNEAAIESVNALTEELERQDPRKNRLMAWLNAIRMALPDVAEVATAVAKLVTLFQ